MLIRQSLKAAATLAAVFLSVACHAQAGATGGAATGGAAAGAPSGAAAGAKPAGGQVYDPALVDKGKRLYVSNCTRCHGLNMVAVSSAFFDLRTFPPEDKPRFIESVTKGKRVMPAWEGILKPDEIEALWSYVQSGHKK